MIFVAAFLAGAGFGWWRAGKRGGNRLDKAQYAAAHGLAVFLVTTVVVVVLDQAGVF